MACEDKVALLHAYLDGELDLVHSLELEDHLKSCAKCAQQVAGQQSLRDAIQASELYHRAPEGLEDRVRGSIFGKGGRHTRKTVRSETAGSLAVQRRHLLSWAAAAVAIVLAAILGMELVSVLLGRHQSGLIAQEAVASHIRSLQAGAPFRRAIE